MNGNMMPPAQPVPLVGYPAVDNSSVSMPPVENTVPPMQNPVPPMENTVSSMDNMTVSTSNPSVDVPTEQPNAGDQN